MGKNGAETTSSSTIPSKAVACANNVIFVAALSQIAHKMTERDETHRERGARQINLLGWKICLAHTWKSYRKILKNPGGSSFKLWNSSDIATAVTAAICM